MFSVKSLPTVLIALTLGSVPVKLLQNIVLLLVIPVVESLELLVIDPLVGPFWLHKIKPWFTIWPWDKISIVPLFINVIFSLIVSVTKFLINIVFPWFRVKSSCNVWSSPILLIGRPDTYSSKFVFDIIFC